MANNQNVLFKKNIILIPADYDGISNQKGVLSLDFFSNKIVGQIRCFNLKPTDEVYNIGISAGDSIFKTTATAKELNNLKVEMNAVVNNSSKISCVIVKLSEKKYTTLLWGSTEATRAMEQSFFVENLLYKTEIINSQQFSQQSSKNIEQNSKQNDEIFVQKNADNFSKNYDYNSKNNQSYTNQNLSEKQEEIFEDEMLENYIDKVMAQTDDSAFESVDNKKNDRKKENSNSFYDKISVQVEKMFEQNEPDKMLEKLLPNSKFCKVNSENGYYVFGVINQNGAPKCLCYGVPLEFYDAPPKDIEGFCQWLPLDAENYKGSGYWLTYQDAITGENVEVEIVS